MSIKLMSKVFDGQFKIDGGPTEPIMKLVLLALADHASDSGEAIYPSIAHVCSKTGLSRHAVKDALAAARKIGILTAIGRRRQVIEYRMQISSDLGPKWDQAPEGTRTPGDPAPGPLGTMTRTPGDHVIIIDPSSNHHSADAQSFIPSGEQNSKRPRRDALDIQASFDALKAKGAAAGRDRLAAAHRMAGRWPHLVEHARAFEAASGLDASTLTDRLLKRWVADLEQHLRAGLTPEHETTLVAMARKRKTDIYSPGSVDYLIPVMQAKAPAQAVTEPTYAKPSF